MNRILKEFAPADVTGIILVASQAAVAGSIPVWSIGDAGNGRADRLDVGGNM